VRPRALAALRLMTRWKVVGCSIGRAAGREPLVPPLRPAPLNNEILPLDIAEIAQSLPESLHRWTGLRGRKARTEPTDPVHFRRLLRRGDHWRGEDAKGKYSEEADSCAPHKHPSESISTVGALVPLQDESSSERSAPAVLHAPYSFSARTLNTGSGRRKPLRESSPRGSASSSSSSTT
jgi:hypothetical protein